MKFKNNKTNTSLFILPNGYQEWYQEGIFYRKNSHYFICPDGEIITHDDDSL